MSISTEVQLYIVNYRFTLNLISFENEVSVHMNNYVCGNNLSDYKKGQVYIYHMKKMDGFHFQRKVRRGMRQAAHSKSATWVAFNS